MNPFYVVYRSTESKPPDYDEATSEFYPESSEVVNDNGGDPPPPYGPPTYEQAVSDETKEGGANDISGEGQEEELNVNGSESRTENSGQNVSGYNGTMTVPHQEYNIDGGHAQEQFSAFQDMPTVTL